MGFILSPFRMFPLSRFRLRLRSFTFSCSFSPLPSDLTHRRSFGLRARCRTSTYYSIAVSYLITGPLFRIRRRAMSLAGLHSFQLWFSFSPLTTFPLRSVYCRSLEHESYKYPSPGFVETRQPRPLSLSLSFSSRLCLRVLRLVPIASDPFRQKPVPTQTKLVRKILVSVRFPSSFAFVLRHRVVVFQRQWG